MIQIDSVDIWYFRSIYRVRLRKLGSVTVLAGKNDVGKSNIVKALNLFFNNETDWKTGFAFPRDFSRRRRDEVRQKTIKGRQFIKISVGFVRGERFPSLPKRFRVTKTWYRDSAIPQVTYSMKQTASLQRYLNTVHFEYVPAIKDQAFFTYILGSLQDLILEKKSHKTGIAKAIADLNSVVRSQAIVLNTEFERASGIATEIKLPERLDELFRAFSVSTKLESDEMPLHMRGDGIRSRFVPSLLHYVSVHSKKYYVWGFEEPENSLEHGLATKLAQELAKNYASHAQILLTSHSPAFFKLDGPDISVYRVSSTSTGATVHQLGDSEADGERSSDLYEELGLMELQKELQQTYEERLAQLNERVRKVAELDAQIKQEQGPILLVEGKHDATILGIAWKKLNRSKSCPFRILPADVGEGSGGAQVVRARLAASMAQDPVTVGLFDRDREGMQKAFNQLGERYEADPKDANVKKHKSHRAAAVVLPTVPGRERYADHLNLELEFYFPDDALAQQVKGKGLVLEQPEIERRVTKLGVSLDPVTATEPHLRQIHPDSKKLFAEQVVPSLPESAFSNFASLFKRVRRTIAGLKRRR